MTRFERHPILTLSVILLVLVVAVVAASEWLLRPSGERDELIGHESSPRPDRQLRLREWQPDTRFTFGTVEKRRVDPGEALPDTYLLETDGEGFIEPSAVHADPDLEIVFVGGSTTECLYVAPENRFPHVAARRLEEHTGLSVNGLNAGKSGNNTMLSLLAIIGKVLPRRPDYVVLMHATNDIGVLNRYETYWNDSSDFGLVGRRERNLETWVKDLRDMAVPYGYRRLKRGLKQLSAAAPSAIGNAVADTGGATSGDASLSKEQRMGRDFESALRSFVAVVRAWHSEPVLMTQVLVRANQEGRQDEGAFLGREALAAGRFTPESFTGTHEYFNAIVRQVALSEGVPLIDLAAARDWTDKDVYDGLHFSDAGAINAGQAIAAALAELIRP